MEDASFNFDIEDKASSKIRRIKGEADKVAVSLKNTADVLRAGGGLAEGGVLGKIGGRIGGLAPMLMGGSAAMGKFGIAAMAAGIGFQAFSNIVSSSMDIFEDALHLHDKYTDAVREGTEAKKSFAAVSISQAPSLKKLLLSGGSMAMVKDAQEHGISYDDAVNGETALALMPSKDRGLYRDKAMNIAATGVMRYGEAATKLRERRGNDYGVMLESLGLRNTPDAREKVTRMLMGVRGASGYEIPGIDNINSAVAESGVLGREGASRLTSGESTTAIKSQNDATLDPTHAIMKRANQAITDHIVTMQKLAGNENEFMAALQDFGWLIFKSRSASGKLEDYSKSVALSRGQ